MERFVDANVGVLSNVFAAVWGVVVGGMGDNCKCEEWILGDIGCGGADFPTFLLVELDEDERNVLVEYQCEVVATSGKATCDKPWLGRVAQSADAAEVFGVEKCVYAEFEIGAIFE